MIIILTFDIYDYYFDYICALIVSPEKVRLFE